LYRTAEGWVFLACLFDREWTKFCTAAGCTDLLNDSRFSTAAARVEYDAELSTSIGEVFAKHPADHWEELLTADGVACVRADFDLARFLEQHPQANANQMVVEVDSPRFGKYLRHGPIIKFSEAPARLEHGSFPGEHTVRVMRELGYTDSQITDLRSRRIVDWEETARLPSAR
jgi:crotonobetainyl-CoA:carnitine CoA-transferase CaiB-like acyl-CoA transferase